MKMKMFVMVAMLALSGAAFAQGNPHNPSDHNDDGHYDCGHGGCNGTPGTPGGHNGNGGNGGNGGSGGTGVGVGVGVGVGIANAEATATSVAVASNNTAVDVRNTNTNTNLNSNVNNVSQGQVQGQSQTATGGNANATNTNSNTANGGEGGTAVAAAVVESGAVEVAEGAVQSNLTYTYKEVRQAPAIGQGSFAIAGCSVAGNAGASGPGGAGFLGFGFTPQQCYDFMLAQAYQSLGEKKAACDILRNSKAGKRQEKRGITLPGCEPEVKTVVVPAPVVAPAPDLSGYATKEELNRAFKASMSK